MNNNIKTNTEFLFHINRDSVCMGDDCTTHDCIMHFPANTELTAFLYQMSIYVPAMSNVVWSVTGETRLYGYLVFNKQANATLVIPDENPTLQELVAADLLCVKSEKSEPTTLEVFCRYFHQSSFTYMDADGNHVNKYSEYNILFQKVKEDTEHMRLYLMRDLYIPLVENWLNRKHVKQWYEIPEKNIKIEDWMSEIKEYNGSYQWITYLIIIWKCKPVGMCLYYRCEDSKDEDFASLPLEGSYGIDYLIGEEFLLRKGLGKQMLTLLKERILSLPNAKRVTADIDKDNKASAGLLRSCGFQLLNDSGNRYVYTKE